MGAICIDCGVDTTPDTFLKRGGRRPIWYRWEWYMVHDEIWVQAGMPHRKFETGYGTSGFLCIGCLETRIGRKLRRADFTSARINDPDKPNASARLRLRLRKRKAA